MTEIRKYRQWAAATLLVVYAFIATPVQLWHHHSPAKQTVASEKTFDKGHPFISSSGISADDCQVCAHKYSTYTSHTCIPEIPAVVFYKDTRPDFCSSIILSPSFHFSNKSPPVRA
ncbi:hypothetical protein [Agriterribacter sp.]|uniref:hypothetical protein n=1 Tax=Agriterribacter sp. TaxID=2821509 RepID=UPI002C78A187|nr:hypothetical protein [Agriterribacter sp.]HRP55449.1 hypothetical protein [Agriterribacter sp.]